ncbi:RNA polymerase sigma factor [Xenorhabdus lircayensis]|uniref:RNA polymerase sigma factor n=1 Tax=Xenorhabdus lircayensis TaxID=2763499 RepID=A0ABS0U581_9GAMM|nr:RNA polymerase sigma factor [Xenorhabdus lircayensis]MBI6549043.1 RNA polymerase sigma factor [Xenorhabdus lircayensis]
MSINKSLAHKVSHAYQLTYKQLMRFFHKRVENSSDSSDLSQDVFALWLNRKKQTPVRESRAFLFKIANNVLIDHWRKKQKQQAIQEEESEMVALQVPGKQADPAEIVEQQQRLQRLYDAIKTLPPRRREAFLMYRFEGLSQNEIAERMGISTSMVEKHIASALVHCKNYVDYHGENQ